MSPVPDGRKVIAADPDVAPIVAKLFEWYATGEFALKGVAKKARAAGLAYKKSGAPVPHQHGAFDPAQSPLYRLVRVER